MKKSNSGIIFWITGLSGSGKSTIGKYLKPLFEKKYGKTILIHGDDIRKIFQFKLYTKTERLKLGISYSNICKLIAKQKINVIFTTVGLFNKLFLYNRKNLQNYIEIYIKTNIQKLKKNRSKSFYKVKMKNVWGLDLKPEYPKRPDILIKNNFDKSPAKLAKIIFEKIKKLKIKA
jgi:cytidine diphosphoramidate kinase